MVSSQCVIHVTYLYNDAIFGVANQLILICNFSSLHFK